MDEAAWFFAAPLAQRMFDLDSELPVESRNWNHNLAHALKTAAKIQAKRPRKWPAFAARFDAADWLNRGIDPLLDIADIDRALAASVRDMLKRIAQAHVETNHPHLNAIFNAGYTRFRATFPEMDDVQLLVTSQHFMPEAERQARDLAWFDGHLRAIFIHTDALSHDDATLQGIIWHELGHAADPDIEAPECEVRADRLAQIATGSPVRYTEDGMQNSRYGSPKRPPWLHRNPAGGADEDCAWCGAEIRSGHDYRNRLGEVFCTPGHRSASNRALSRLTGRTMAQMVADRKRLAKSKVRNPQRIASGSPYKVGPVTFWVPRGEDRVSHMSKVAGIASDVMDWDHYGFITTMLPSVYLRLAAPTDLYRDTPMFAGDHYREGDTKMAAMKRGIADGVHYAPPKLNFRSREVEGREWWYVTGHEGRHRMEAVRSMHGDVPVPMFISIRPLGRSDRTRDLTDDMLASLNYGAESETPSSGRPPPHWVPGPLFGPEVIIGDRTIEVGAGPTRKIHRPPPPKHLRYIAYDDEGAIWGLGTTAAKAAQDATITAEASLSGGFVDNIPDSFKTFPATKALFDKVEMEGGDVEWDVRRDGVADTALPPMRGVDQLTDPLLEMLEGL